MSYNFPADKFDGFLTSLYQRYGAANCEKVFSIVSTEKHSSTYSDPIQLFNPSPSNNVTWHTKNVTNSSIEIIFKKTRFVLSAVSIRSRIDDARHFPTELSIEGSNNGAKWYLLHHYAGSSLTGKGKEETLYTIGETKRPYSRFKVILMQTDSSGYFYFILNRLEFFGYIPHRSCINQVRSNSLLFLNPFITVLLYR